MTFISIKATRRATWATVGQTSVMLSTLGVHGPYDFVLKSNHTPEKVSYHLSVTTPLYSPGLSRALSMWNLPRMLYSPSLWTQESRRVAHIPINVIANIKSVRCCPLWAHMAFTTLFLGVPTHPQKVSYHLSVVTSLYSPSSLVLCRCKICLRCYIHSP